MRAIPLKEHHLNGLNCTFVNKTISYDLIMNACIDCVVGCNAVIDCD